MAVVSAMKGTLDELYSLFDNIQKDKKKIVKQVDDFRIKNIIHLLTDHIEELMKASSSDKELDEAIRRSQYELDKVKRNIDRLIDSMSDEIEDLSRTTSRKFEDTIFTRLNTLVTGKSNNFDAEAISTINNTATLLMNEYRNNIQTLLKEQAKKQKGTDDEIPLSSLETLDLSSIHVSGLSYNLDLNTMGHEYDGWIKTGVIAIAAVGATAAFVSTGGTSAVAAAATVDNVIDVADTVTDVGSIVSNQRTANRIEKAVGFVGDASKQYSNIDGVNQQVGQQMGSNKGMIDSIVGLVTDNLMSKPQRVRAVRNYIDASLAPEFKSSLLNISQTLVNAIRNNLMNEASELIGQKTDSLNQLKAEMKQKKDLFNQRMDQLREYKTTLLSN